jgi:hypothetical protein
MGGRLVALALLTVALPAWAQSEEDYDKYAQPVIDKFTACERPKIVKWAQRGQEAPNDLTNRAIKECQEHLDELQRVMEAEPFSLTPEEAKAAIKQMLDSLRPLMLDDIAQARKA